MNPSVQSLLKEFYAADPKLQQYESTLVALIERMLAAKPNVAIDARFRAELRARLLESIAERDQRGAFGSARRFVWAFGGAIILLVVAIPVIYVSLRNGGSASDRSDTLGSWGITQRLGANAFGTLNAESVKIATTGDRGAGENATDEGAREPSSSDGSPDIMPVEYTTNVYEYVGAPLTLPSGSLTVYRREPGFQNLAGTGRLLRNIDSGLIDLSKFSTAELSSIWFSEDRENGYNVSFDLAYGAITMSENWSTWPLLRAAEAGGYQPIPEEEVLTERESIAITNAFLDEYGINRSQLGAPVVQDNGGYSILADVASRSASAPDEKMAYLPESATVVYPLVIDGKTVYDVNGQPYGLNVQVNFRTKSVSGLNNLRSMNLATSTYAAVTDDQAILDIVKRGGVYGMIDPNATTQVAYEIGDPELVLVAMQSYSSDSTAEYFVPAFRFPITKSPEGQTAWQTAIVVPLIADFLESPDYGTKILPVDRGVGTNASSGSAGAAVEPSDDALSEPVEAPTEIVNASE